MTLQEQIERINGWNDWSASIIERNGHTMVCEFSKSSPAGQDFSFTIYTDDDGSSLQQDIYEYYKDYVPSQEAYYWLDETGHGKNGAPYDMRDVYDDMVKCKDMIGMLYWYALNLQKEQEKVYEIVECCPYCETENVYEMPKDSEYIKAKFIATCKKCGKTIFLCDECLHCEDNPNGDCDWRQINGCSKCMRGCIKEGDKK